MSDTKKHPLDDASTGGGIGDIPAQPLDQFPSGVEHADPLVDVDSETGRVEGEGLAPDADRVPSGEDPDDDADSTQGQPS